MGAIMDPAAAGSRVWCGSRGAEAMPPLWQYLCLRQKRLEPISAPKGIDPGASPPFPCKMTSFEGPCEGAMIAFMDPDAPTQRAGWETEPDAPLWQYFARVAKPRSACAHPKGI
jgi:hypothetical protein